MLRVPFSEEEIKRAIELYNEGYSSVKIGRELGRTPTVVRRALAPRGYKFEYSSCMKMNEPEKVLIEQEVNVFKSKPVVVNGKVYQDITYAPNPEGVGQMFGCEVLNGAWYEWYERRTIKRWV